MAFHVSPPLRLDARRRLGAVTGFREGGTRIDERCEQKWSTTSAVTRKRAGLNAVSTLSDSLDIVDSLSLAVCCAGGLPHAESLFLHVYLPRMALRCHSFIQGSRPGYCAVMNPRPAAAAVTLLTHGDGPLLPCSCMPLCMINRQNPAHHNPNTPYPSTATKKAWYLDTHPPNVEPDPPTSHKPNTPPKIPTPAVKN